MNISLIQLLLFPATLVALCLPASGEVIRISTQPERTAVLRKAGSEVVIQIDLNSRPAVSSGGLPLNLALVLDRSSSMRGAKMEQAKQAVHAVLDRLTPNDRVSLVAYDSRVETIAKPALATTAHVAQLRKRVDAITPSGTTALHGGVQEGAGHVRAHFGTKTVNRIILMSDGQANVGPRTPKELARLGSDLGEEGIRVTTIGLGNDYNEDLMVGLAEASLANYYYVADVEKLPDIFREELGRIRDIVARDIRIRIHTPRGVTPVEIIGHPEIEIRNNEAIIPMAEIYAAQNRYFLVRCRIDTPARMAGSQDVLTVNASYTDASSLKPKTKQVSQSIKWVSTEKESEATLAPGIVEARLLAYNVAIKDQALALNDAGDYAAASELLARQSQLNALESERINSPKLREESDKLRSSSATVSAGEMQMNSASRKSYQYDNYKDKKQITTP